MPRCRRKTCLAYKHCDSWSVSAVARCEKARCAWLAKESLPVASPMAECHICVGTDCSGTDAPVIGLETVGISVSHIFACDIAWHAREWIQSVTTHENLLVYEDMLEREYDTSECQRVLLRFPMQALELAQ